MTSSDKSSQNSTEIKDKKEEHDKLKLKKRIKVYIMTFDIYFYNQG